MSLHLDGTGIEIDNEGYLLDTSNWSPELAAVIARGQDMELTEEHQEIVHFVRNHFEECECIPELRTLLTRTSHHADKPSLDL